MLRRSQSAGSKSRIERLERRRFLAAHILGSSVIYSTIQAAIDAASAGAVINVDAGTYADATVVYKSLTLRGVEAGVDARSNQRAANNSETAATGATGPNGVSYAFYITANDVTLDGFTVQGNTNSSLGTSAGIVIAPNVAGTHIVNNLIQNNVSGLFLANSSSTDAAVIQYNVFKNNNNTGDNGGRGIYTDQDISGGTLTNVMIDSNAFINNGGASGVEAAVAFEATNANSQSDLRITNNVMDSNGKAALFFNSTNVIITGNTIYNSQDSHSGALRFEGNNHTVTIQGNTVYLNTNVGVAIDSKGVAGNSSGFVVTGNNFYGNSSLETNHLAVVYTAAVYDGSLDTRNNWWGAADGPRGDGSGSGDAVGNGNFSSGAGFVYQSGGSELFSPWATSAFTVATSNYLGAPAVTGVPIQAEDFNQGGDGVGYHSSTATNHGGAYRTGAVSIGTTSDAGGGYFVGWAGAGEWLGYSLNVAAAGTYRIDSRVSNNQANAGTFHVEVDGTNVTGSVSVPHTSGWQTYQTLLSIPFTLTAGAHSVKLVCDGNGEDGFTANFNWFRFTPTVSWITQTSNATWNPATHTLTATGPVSINADPGSDLPLVTAGGSASHITINPPTNTVHFGGLSLSNGASITLTSLGAARTAANHRILIIGTPNAAAAPAYAVDAASTLDLTDNDMAILYGSGASPLANVQTNLLSAYDNHLWDKPGLMSTNAKNSSNQFSLGYGESTTLGWSTFDGPPLGSHAVVVKYTIPGDATLTGTDDLTDYTTVVQNVGRTGLAWTDGNFDYTGTVGLGDYSAVVQNFGSSAGTSVATDAVVVKADTRQAKAVKVAVWRAAKPHGFWKAIRKRPAGVGRIN